MCLSFEGVYVHHDILRLNIIMLIATLLDTLESIKELHVEESTLMERCGLYEFISTIFGIWKVFIKEILYNESVIILVILILKDSWFRNDFKMNVFWDAIALKIVDNLILDNNFANNFAYFMMLCQTFICEIRISGLIFNNMIIIA